MKNDLKKAFDYIKARPLYAAASIGFFFIINGPFTYALYSLNDQINVLEEKIVQLQICEINDDNSSEPE